MRYFERLQYAVSLWILVAGLSVEALLSYAIVIPASFVYSVRVE